jgi:hypothetical protein
VIDEAIDAFYKTVMGGFKYLYPEQSEAESKDAIQKAQVAAHFGNPLANVRNADPALPGTILDS